MIINGNFTLFQNQQSKPTFKAVDYFHPIKNSPKMICGCCGKKTLSIIRYMKTITSIALPLQVQLEKGALDYLEKSFPKAWETIKRFSENNPTKTLDEILHYKNIGINDKYVELRNAVAQDIEQNKEDIGVDDVKQYRHVDKIFFDLNDFGRTYMKQSSIVIDRLMPLAQYLSGAQREVFDQFMIYSKKYPKKTLSEIVREPEVEQFHKEQYFIYKAEKNKQLEQHFQNILMIVEENNPTLVSIFQGLQEQAIKMLRSVRDISKRKYLLEKMYKEALDKYCSNIKKEDVIREINQLPESFVSKDNFFMVAADNKYTDIEIVNSMFGNILASEKYIIPLEQGGSDKIGNKIVMCRSCNTRTKTIPYREVIKYRAKMPENMQKQMDIITGEILDGSFNARLRAYPIYVAEYLNTASKGAIKLDIIDYCEEIIDRSKRKIKSNKKDMSWLRKNKNFKPTNKAFLNEKEQVLQEKMQKFIAENKEMK